MAEKFPIYIKTYDEARNIIEGFSKQEAYLRDLVWNRVWRHLSEEEKQRWPIEYRDLLYHAKRILEVARKILRTRPSDKPGVESKLDSEEGQAQPTRTRQPRLVQTEFWDTSPPYIH